MATSTILVPEEGEEPFKYPTTQEWWTQILGDVESGTRTDFTQKTPTVPTYEEWLTPEKEAYYAAREAALVPRTGDSGADMTIPWSAQPELQSLAAAAGLPYSTNPPEYDYLNTYYNVPSYGGTDPFVNLPIYAAMAFGGAAAGGALSGATVGAGGGVAGGGVAAADTAGLAQMAADAGLTGSAADAFVASGGALGSTAAAAGPAKLSVKDMLAIGTIAQGLGVGASAPSRPRSMPTIPFINPNTAPDEQAREQERRAAAAAIGHGDTILTSPLGILGTSYNKKKGPGLIGM